VVCNDDVVLIHLRQGTLVLSGTARKDGSTEDKPNRTSYNVIMSTFTIITQSHRWTQLRLLLVLPLSLMLFSCTPVRANQKQRLADPIMVFDRDHVHTEMIGHISTPREGAIGGFSSAGAGGCGCN
jgi:hypothetical protein